MMFIVNRFDPSAFGLAMAVREFASVLPGARLAARRADPGLMAQAGLTRVPVWRAVLGRDRAWHVNDMFAPVCIVLTVLGLLTGRDVILCPHGMLDRWALRTRRYRAKRAILALYDCLARVGRLSIHALTPAEARKARALLPRAARIAIVPNGVPADILALQATLPDRATRTGPVVVGTFSRVAPKKNQVALVALAAHLRDTRPALFAAAEFRIDGQVEDPAYMARIEARIAAEGLGGRIRIGGAVAFEDRGALLAGYDILFFPSHSEGMPYVVLEAMALGVRPLAAATAACGFAVPYGAVLFGDIAEAAARLPEGRAALGAVDRAGVLRDYGDGRLRAFLNDFEKGAP